MVPSMHVDLANDPVTEDIVEQTRQQGVEVLWGPVDEGSEKRQQSNASSLRWPTS